MKITFNKIHTEKKQKMLKQMMSEINDEVSKIKNENKKLRSCPICKTKEISDYVEAYKFNMSICKKCDLIFCNPYPNDEQLHKYYNSKMKSFENEFFRESFDNRVELFKPRVELIKNYKSSGRLLDIGSAIGIFIEALSQNQTNFEVTCCDMSEEACSELKEKYPDYRVINNNFLNIDTKNKFDIISMWDTLEHIVDQNLLLKKIYELLEDDGLFVFSTPNTHSFEWEIAKENHVQILPPGHVNLMSEKNIKILLQNNNMELIDSYTLNASLDISYVKKIILNNEVDEKNIGLYLKEKIFDKKFEKAFEDYLVSTKQAGNIVVIAGKKVSSISKDFIFKKNGNTLEFIGDFDGLYKSEANPWGQDGTDDRLGDYYKFSQNNILKNLKDFKHFSKMLEVGCGLGYVVDFFNKNSHLSCDGADISKVAIKKAKMNFPQYTFYKYDVQDDVSSTYKYDIVVLNNVLWYVLEKFENVFSNIYDILNKNGIFIISNAFMKEQNYGRDIVDGFDGLVDYIETRQSDKFKIRKTNLSKKEDLYYQDGCVVMEKLDE